MWLTKEERLNLVKKQLSTTLDLLDNSSDTDIAENILVDALDHLSIYHAEILPEHYKRIVVTKEK